jgi:hypothetical protein
LRGCSWFAHRLPNRVGQFDVAQQVTCPMFRGAILLKRLESSLVNGGSLL